MSRDEYLSQCFLYRQCAVVLQQHHTLLCRTPCNGGIGVAAHHCLVGIVVRACRVVVDDAQSIASLHQWYESVVNLFLCDKSFVHRLMQ